jgi:transformation/transcription domain-associated protein
MSTTSALSAPVLSGSMNWEPVRKRLLGADLKDALLAATELRENIEIVHTVEFPLMLSALLPAFSSVLAHRTRPSPDTQSVEHKFRNLVLDIISKMPSNEYLRPHAPHLVALAIDVLNRDYEENALLASRIIFDLYKVYRSLPPDYVQPYLDFVQGAYRALPAAIQRNFTFPALSTASPHSAGPVKTETAPVESSEKKEAPPPPKSSDADVVMTDVASVEKKKEDEGETKKPDATATTPSAATKTPDAATTTPSAAMSVDSTGTSSLISGLPVTPMPRLALRSNISFRVLTECPLIVMLMFQLYPKFLKNNIPLLINVMMEAMALRAPPIQSLTPPNQQNLDSTIKRMYFSRARELVAAQAKTLSFLTYLLRSFSAELKPYEDRLASNVVALMSTCPRESIGTRKELLVATRHLLNSDFKSGFFRHVDALLDERVLMGSHHRFSDQTLLRPLGYTTLSDLVQHVRSMLTMSQMSRVVCMFSRVLHDSLTLPMSTQYTAVRTLLSLVEIIYLNKDPNAQIGRDMLVRTLKTLVDKLASLNDYFPVVMKSEAARETETIRISSIKAGVNVALPSTPPDTVRDLQSMIRAIIVGHKTVIYYINNYRNQNAKDKTREQMMPPPGSNEEVSSATLRLTNTEVAIVDKYIVAAFPAMKFLKEKGTLAGQLPGRPAGEKSLIEQHRDSLTYFAAAFTTLDGYNLRRTIGKRLDLLVDAIVDDPMMMVVPRHLLGSNPSTSFEFCNLLLNYLMERMDLLAFPRPKAVVYVELPSGHDVGGRELVMQEVQRSSQFPVESEERQKQRSTTLLQLFERVLKSLSSFAENEAGVVRRRLRKIVVVCLRSSLENTVSWPDNYCMLLRYLFRSISAGKFEESYKELLPLIPTVLNGLYRVICASEDLVLRQTAIELCLTIPARLSSLLPHMNLLLRVIIPALDSRSGDLVNLG